MENQNITGRGTSELQGPGVRVYFSKNRQEASVAGTVRAQDRGARKEVGAITE